MARRLLGLLPLLWSVISDAGPRQVIVRLTPTPGLDVPCQGRIAAESCNGGTCEQTGRRFAFSMTEPAVIELDRDEPGRLSFEADDCWVPSVEIRAGAGVVDARAWKAATVRGRISVPAREAPIPEVVIRISLADAGKTLSTTTRARVDQDAWSVKVPAATIDVEVSPSVPGYASVYARRLLPSAGTPTDLGVIELRRGASIVGSVDTAGSRVGSEEVTVELRPEQFQVAGAATGRAEPVRTRLAGDGFFQFTGVEPGTYELRAVAPQRSPARVSSIVITDPKEYAIERVLQLEPLLPVRVMVTPPVDALQQPWTIVLSAGDPRSMLLEPVARSSADQLGWWIQEAVPAGVYRVAVLDASGATLQSERLELTAPGATVEIKLPLIPIRGTVRAGASPLRSELHFSQTGGRNVTLQADDDGEFAGLLPHDGKWTVRVMATEKRFYVLKTVDVATRDDSTPSVIDIRLPGGKIRGSVVDDRGDPVSADVVVLRGDRPTADAATDEKGTFELLGLEPGPVALRAVTRGAESGLVTYDVSEVVAPNLRLTVRKQRMVRGRLIARDGHPLAGALIRYVAPTIAGIGHTNSGPSGELELSVPADTGSITLAVLVPGMPLSIRTMRLSEDELPQLVVGAAAGRLLVRLSRPPPVLFVVASGQPPFPMNALVFPPDGSGRPPRGVLPEGFAFDIEPGPYKVCGPALQACLSADVRAGSDSIVNGDTFTGREETK